MGKTKIAWCDYSWNPYQWRCQAVSPGCANCYARNLAKRYGKDFGGPFATRWPAALKELRTFEAGSRVFVNDMSDTYYEKATHADIHRVHNAARQNPHLYFLLLTKRIERALALAPYLDWPPNLWIGTTVENDSYLWRLDYLRRIPAAGRFVSFEPLIRSVGQPDLQGIQWVITGGESGPNRRPFDPAWAVDVLHAARKHGAAFFHKQGSGLYPGSDRYLNKKMYEELPNFNRSAPAVG